MTELEKKAKEYRKLKKQEIIDNDDFEKLDRFDENVEEAYIAGAKENGVEWHEIFIDSKPNPCEYWELPQENLPEKENFYFVKLKNGFIKICELKYDHLSKKKSFYNLRGVKQSNVAEWLDYPTV